MIIIGKLIFNKHTTLVKRKLLRINSTKEEILLWEKLKNRRFHNLKFRRQHGIGEYIVDFYCKDLNLVIELDGKQHYEKDNLKYDEIRTEILNSLGLKVIRFENKKIINNMEMILEEILHYM